MLILHHLDDTRVAAQPARGLAGQERLRHLATLDWIERRAGAKAARWNREHHLDRSTLRPVAAQIALGHRHQCIGTVEGPPGRSSSITQRTYLALAACSLQGAPHRLCACELALRVALPGHEDVIEDPPGRARELQEHHRVRLEETLAALAQDEPRSGYDLSFALFGDDLKPAGRRFAVAETLSHAERLVHLGAASRHETAGTVTYTAN